MAVEETRRRLPAGYEKHRCDPIRAKRSDPTMAIQSPYLFSAAMDVEPSREGLFNEVYDNEHVPLLLAVPGVVSVARFKREELTMIIGGERRTIVVDAEPRYNAPYELEGPGVLTSAPWAKTVDPARWARSARGYPTSREHVLYRR